MAGNITRAQVLETFSVFAVISLLMAIYSQRQVFTHMALVFLLVALFVGCLAEIVTFWWLKFSSILSSINSRLILFLIYYLILTPIALVYRLLNKDPLNPGVKHGSSFYADRGHTYSKTDLDKMW